ncbi:hypothetical protein NMK71_05000 [Weeksellaceae bacterium KMM 9713]|uniref:Uncharacterized protein n=1 Tax=Profundicola chukchiensis TaxID=2961959 RepID=A0A9X4RX74_9FLAO|nr:hypothetical protein [Profundicola chukchiensis]MDG4945764.1 hypothetical protein [Profundicola chukchiensis]
MKKYIFFLFLVIFSWANAQIDEKIKFDVVKEFTQKFLEAQKDTYNHNDLKNYQKEIKPKLDTITSIGELEELLIKNDFKNTYENVVARLYDLNFNGEYDDLAEDAKSLMQDKVDINDIYLTLSMISEDVHVEQVEHNELEESPASEAETEIKNEIPKYVLVLLAIFILSTLILSVLCFILFKELKNYKSVVSKINLEPMGTNKKNFDQNHNNRSKEIYEKPQENPDIEKENDELNNIPDNDTSSNYIPETPVVVELPVDKSDLETKSTINEPTVEEVKEKYAPKLIGEGWELLSDYPKSSTLYHLKKTSNDEFSFEIYEYVEKRVLNEVSNFPDQTLYNACFNQNSNLDFKNEIKTLKQGRIVKKEDLYVVVEKAVIKFE